MGALTWTSPTGVERCFPDPFRSPYAIPQKAPISRSFAMLSPPIVLSFGPQRFSALQVAERRLVHDSRSERVAMYWRLTSYAGNALKQHVSGCGSTEGSRGGPIFKHSERVQFCAWQIQLRGLRIASALTKWDSAALCRRHAADFGATRLGPTNPVGAWAQSLTGEKGMGCTEVGAWPERVTSPIQHSKTYTWSFHVRMPLPEISIAWKERLP